MCVHSQQGAVISTFSQADTEAREQRGRERRNELGRLREAVSHGLPKTLWATATTTVGLNRSSARAKQMAKAGFTLTICCPCMCCSKILTSQKKRGLSFYIHIIWDIRYKHISIYKMKYIIVVLTLSHYTHIKFNLLSFHKHTHQLFNFIIILHLLLSHIWAAQQHHE